MPPEFLSTGTAAATVHFLCAHGAGGAMDSPFLNTLADLLAVRAIATQRFEFAYMAARRTGGPRKPPPKAEKLMGEYRAAVASAADGPLIIGGKSMGGRVASLVADELFAQGRIMAVVCLGYPFHPPHKSDQWRTQHLKTLRCPALIIQGERDPFGSRSEVDGLHLSAAIRIHWSGDGDHDLAPRAASGFTRKGNLAAAADAMAQFAASLQQQRATRR